MDLDPNEIYKQGLALWEKGDKPGALDSFHKAAFFGHPEALVAAQRVSNELNPPKTQHAILPEAQKSYQEGLNAYTAGDLPKARFFFQAAAHQGHPFASQAFSHLNAQLPSEEPIQP